jgi:hypothetical protein
VVSRAHVDAKRVIRRLVIVFALASLLVSCSGHVVNVKGDLDLAGEAKYRTVWRDGWTDVERVNATLTVCNAGGSAQSCAKRSTEMISAVRRLRTRLVGVHTPPRYDRAQGATVRALDQTIAGYEQRNRGFSANSNPDFVAGNDSLKRARSDLHAAYLEFPKDARPLPAV